jgi:hypothetical protein
MVRDGLVRLVISSSAWCCLDGQGWPGAAGDLKLGLVRLVISSSQIMGHPCRISESP